MSAISKQQATTLTRAAQLAVALLLVGAGSALAVSWRSRDKGVDLPGPLEIPVADLGIRRTSTEARDVDAESVADRLGAVANHPKPAQTIPTPGTAPTTTTPVASGSQDTRFLGAVAMGSTKMALVAEGGKQKFVGVGDALAGGTVEQITDSEVRIGGGVSKTLTLATRTADVLTRAGRNAPGAILLPPSATQSNNLGGLRAYTPPQQQQPVDTMGKPMTVDQLNYRQRLNVPDYVAPGDEHDFVAMREEMRNSEKFSSEDELNEMASKRWEEKRGSSPELTRYLKEREAARKLEEAEGRKPGEQK